MKSRLLLLLAVLALAMPAPAFARGHGGGGGSHRSSGGCRRHSTGGFGGGGHRGGGLHVHVSTGGHRRRTTTAFRGATGVARDSHGRIKRSESAKNEFKRAHPCPSNGKSGGACPGYVIDHVKPLKRGGADAPSNMQWQTKEAAKAKDKWE